jgi:hypothetical protein
MRLLVKEVLVGDDKIIIPPQKMIRAVPALGHGNTV